MARILIVDDDPDVVESVTQLLETNGHETECAFNRHEGMARIGVFKPDLIVLDVMMEQPDDGLAMAQELRRQGFQRPILMLTSISRATGLVYGKDPDMAPVDDFQEKPVEPVKLLERVNNLLRQREA
ncbi:MAG: response regulator [Candidatus Hydrogenedentes bacterium]|nr:response regulator [Candidatus Hydrogenedentota bacterium]